MGTDHFELDLPKGFEKAIQLTPEEMKAHIRLMAALKMFELPEYRLEEVLKYALGYV